MTHAETDVPSTASADWITRRDLVIAWLLVLFPVGLYAVWRGPLFDQRWKIGITVAAVLVYLVTGPEPMNAAYVCLSFPAALVLLWRSSEVARATRRNFAIGWAVVLGLFLVDLSLAPQGGSGGWSDGNSAVITDGNCTYYRDSNGSVIGRHCD